MSENIKGITGNSKNKEVPNGRESSTDPRKRIGVSKDSYPLRRIYRDVQIQLPLAEASKSAGRSG